MTKQLERDCDLEIDLYWNDCEKEGHEEGCYVAVCNNCGDVMADCEEEKL